MKRLLLAILSLMVLVLAGCAGSAIQQSEPIVIGANMEISGRFAGDRSVQGVKLAIAEVNAAGGVLGRPLLLAAGDNQSDETVAPEIFRKVVQEDKAVAVVGPTYSNWAIASALQSDGLKTPFVATVATNPRVTIDDTGRVRAQGFRVCFIDSFQGAALARFALQRLQADRAALYVDDGSLYSQGLAGFFSDAFSRMGGLVAATASYTPQTPDHRVAIRKLLEKQPNVLFIPGYYTEMASIVATVRELGFTGPIIGGDGWASVLRANPPAQLFNNCFYCCHYAPDDTDVKVQRFQEAYAAANDGQTPSQAAVLAYDATYLLVDAIRRAESTEREKIRQALEQTRGFSGVTGLIRIDERHNAVKSMVMLELRDGKTQFKERLLPE